MKAYLTNILISLRLMRRDRMVLFFGYIFPLVFFFFYAQMYSAGQGSGVAKQVVTSVLIFGVLGNGFMGAGMRAVSDREQNILRRFKVAPTTAAPLLTGWLVTGWINYLPSALFLIALAHFVYQMPWPERPFTLFLFLSVAVLAFRGMGLVIASVVNSMQESSLVVQLFYLPMLFLSGATIPMSIMPHWVQILAQFMPASHLFLGLQGILIRQEGLADQWKSLLALALTAVVTMFISLKLFRWEKEEKVKTSAKLWVVAALVPFLLLGVYQAYTKESIDQAKAMQRELRRSRTVLIRNTRLFIGDGKVVERGGLLVKNGRIDRIFEGDTPDPKSLQADPVDGSGKTLLPGLIDTSVYLSLPGGVPNPESMRDVGRMFERYAASYLFSGVTTIRSRRDPVVSSAGLQRKVERGEFLGSAIVFTGPVFTVKEARGEGSLQYVPEAYRAQAAQQMLRIPTSPAEARQQVMELAGQGVQAIEVDAERLPPDVLAAIRSAGEEKRLPVLNGESGPFQISELAAVEALTAPGPALLQRSLVQQLAPKGMIDATRKLLPASGGDLAKLRERMALLSKERSRVVTGSGSGTMFVIHGPGMHRELMLLVQAGLTPGEALIAATSRAAKALGAEGRIGLLRAGYDADLLLVDGSPLEDIGITERISMVMFKGERVQRGGLIEEEPER